jgi:hypothetical protein
VPDRFAFLLQALHDLFTRLKLFCLNTSTLNAPFLGHQRYSVVAPVHFGLLPIVNPIPMTSVKWEFLQQGSLCLREEIVSIDSSTCQFPGKGKDETKDDTKNEGEADKLTHVTILQTAVALPQSESLTQWSKPLPVLQPRKYSRLVATNWLHCADSSDVLKTGH